MCEIASFIFNPKTMEIKVGKNKIDDHAGTFEEYGLKDEKKPDSWREGHYLQDGTIDCRVLDIDSRSAETCAEIVREKYSTFIDFWNAHPHGWGSIGGSLSLDGLQSAEGLELPDSIGGWLSLDGLQSAEKDILREKYSDVNIF